MILIFAAQKIRMMWEEQRRSSISSRQRNLDENTGQAQTSNRHHFLMQLVLLTSPRRMRSESHCSSEFVAPHSMSGATERWLKQSASNNCQFLASNALTLASPAAGSAGCGHHKTGSASTAVRPATAGGPVAAGISFGRRTHFSEAERQSARTRSVVC